MGGLPGGWGPSPACIPTLKGQSPLPSLEGAGAAGWVQMAAAGQGEAELAPADRCVSPQVLLDATARPEEEGG